MIANNQLMNNPIKIIPHADVKLVDERIIISIDIINKIDALVIIQTVEVLIS